MTDPARLIKLAVSSGRSGTRHPRGDPASFRSNPRRLLALLSGPDRSFRNGPTAKNRPAPFSHFKRNGPHQPLPKRPLTASKTLPLQKSTRPAKNRPEPLKSIRFQKPYPPKMKKQNSHKTAKLQTKIHIQRSEHYLKNKQGSSLTICSWNYEHLSKNEFCVSFQGCPQNPNSFHLIHPKLIKWIVVISSPRWRFKLLKQSLLKHMLLLDHHLLESALLFHHSAEKSSFSVSLIVIIIV